MSELLENERQRKDLLKHMIKELRAGQAPEAVRQQLQRLMGEVPYADVVAVEQELMQEGMPAEEIMKVCDVHMQAIGGQVARGRREVPPGHPAHHFVEENRALQWEMQAMEKLLAELEAVPETRNAESLRLQLSAHLQKLGDVGKHYQRKENLLFPFLEKHGISGPSKVMWGKDDEARQRLKEAAETLSAAREATAGELRAAVELTLRPALQSLRDMMVKEEEILLPMALDNLAEAEWAQIHRQSPEIGFCLVQPVAGWTPVGADAPAAAPASEAGRVRLPSGSLSVAELTAILNLLPVDISFVGADDRVHYFSEGRERIFARNRAVLGREVRNCHPPKSLATVEKILADFRSGAREQAAFWIELHGRFIHIEYFAVRGEGGEYLGTLEVSQDLTAKRSLKGERRLLQDG